MTADIIDEVENCWWTRDVSNFGDSVESLPAKSYHKCRWTLNFAIKQIHFLVHPNKSTQTSDKLNLKKRIVLDGIQVDNNQNIMIIKRLANKSTYIDQRMHVWWVMMHGSSLYFVECSFQLNLQLITTTVVLYLGYCSILWEHTLLTTRACH